MALRKLKLDDNEAFFPLDYKRKTGMVIQLHELKKEGRTLVNIN